MKIADYLQQTCQQWLDGKHDEKAIVLSLSYEPITPSLTQINVKLNLSRIFTLSQRILLKFGSIVALWLLR